MGGLLGGVCSQIIGDFSNALCHIVGWLSRNGEPGIIERYGFGQICIS